MDVKHIHETVEKLAEFMYTEACGDLRAVDTKEYGELVDMVKDLAEAEYYARISCAMKKADEEEEEEAKAIMKRMKEEYGDEEGERMYRMGYNRNRAANGRYTSRGRGRRMGYMPPEMRMPYMEDEFMAEYLDYPEIMGKSGRRMGYGNERSGDTMNGNRGREMGGSREGGSRYGRSYDSYRENRRHYTEMRDEDSKHKMKENIAEIFDDMEDIATEVVKDMTSEEKAKYKQKLQAIMQKMA